MQVRIAPPQFDSAQEWAEYIKALFADTANQTRKSDSRTLVDYYNGKQSSYLESELAKIHSDPEALKQLRKLTVNITRFLSDNIGTTYSGLVKRNLNGFEDDKFKPQDMFWSGLDEVMACANRIISAEKTILIGCNWSPIKTKVNYSLLHQYQFDLVYDPASKDREVMAVIVSDYKPTAFDKTRSAIYTKNSYYEFTGDRLTTENEGVGFIPFVIVNAEPLPIDEDYLDPDSSLTKANLEVNVAFSNLLHLLHRQSHGVMMLTLPEQQPQAVMANDALTNPSGNAQSTSKKPSIRLGVDHVFQAFMDSNGNAPKLEYITQNPNFAEAIETIRFTFESLSINKGLPPDTFGVSTGGSGTATEFWIKERRLRGLQKQLESTFESAEQELFAMAILVADSEKVQLPDDIRKASLDVQYIQEEPLLADATVADLLSLKEAAIIDDVEVLRALYPHMTRSEIEEFQTQMFEQEETPTPTEVQPTVGETSTTGSAVPTSLPTDATGQVVDVQKTALNGAQVTSMIDIVKAVAAKELPRDTGIQILMAAFLVDQSTAEKIMASTGTTFFVEQENKNQSLATAPTQSQE